MKTIFGTITEELTVQKSVRIDVPNNYTEDLIDDALRDRAYKVTMADFENDHGWSCVSTHSIDVDWDVALPVVDQPYSVDAGRYDGNDENCKYSDAFATMDEALEAFDKCQGYPWQRLSYKGRVLMGVEP